jgi:hypothetical protein
MIRGEIADGSLFQSLRRSVELYTQFQFPEKSLIITRKSLFWDSILRLGGVRIPCCLGDEVRKLTSLPFDMTKSGFMKVESQKANIRLQRMVVMSNLSLCPGLRPV